MIKRKLNETYYGYTSRRVADDLGVSLWEVKLVVKYLFKGIRAIINNYEIIFIRGIFKLLLRKRYYMQALYNKKLHKSIYDKK